MKRRLAILIALMLLIGDLPIEGMIDDAGWGPDDYLP